MSTQKKSNVLAIIVMILLFGMISFVTNLASPMGDVLKNQFNVANWMGTLGVFANFIAYACMGIPAGNLLQRRGYKFTALAAVIVGFAGVGTQTIAGLLEGNLAFGVYLLGAFIAGFSMCMLNIVVNPMLNKLAGGGNRGNQLLQLGGSFNSLMGTAVIALVGILIPSMIKANIADVYPLMFTALIIFAIAFVVILFTQIPENENLGEVKHDDSKYGPMSFRHFLLGAIGIFIYVGVEVGIPNVLQKWLNVELENIESVETAQSGVITEVCVKKGYETEAGDVIAKMEVTNIIAAEEGEEPTTEVTIVEFTAESKAIVTEIPEDIKVGAEINVEADQSVVIAKLDTAFAGPIAGTVAATYWLLMLVGRLLGAVLGARISSRKMLTAVSLLGIVLVAGAMILDPANTVNLPVFQNTGFGMAQVPINAALLVLCGLCTSVMWGGIFNLAVEGLGKYTERGSGIFMALVCGGGILPLLQNGIVDLTGNYLVSYWVIVAGLAYLLFYALIGSKNVNKDIPTK